MPNIIYEYNNPTVKEIQKKILEIFKIIACICEQNGLRYFAIGGTCLGAVRHQGFIPWDDDLDIAMPIDDFMKFKSIAKVQLPSHLKIMDGENALHYNQIFIKVHDINTTFIEESLINYPDSYYGIYVDIMPLAGIPEVGMERNRFFKTRLLYEVLNGMRRRPFKEQRSSTRKLIWLLHSPTRFFLPFDYYSKKLFKLLSKYDFDTSTDTGYVWSHNIKNLIFPTNLFNDFVYMDFEDMKIRCPKGWDEYLSLQFGAYMKLPSAEEQIFKHPAIIDLHQSYLNYRRSEG